MSSEHLNEDQLHELLNSEKAGSQQQTYGMMWSLAHLRECSKCFELAERYRIADQKIESVKRLAITANQGECPPQEVWMELVAGIIQGKPAVKLLGHCSNCQTCAQRLRHAQEGLEEEVAEAESASPEWQLQMAQHMAAQVATSKAQNRRKLMLWVSVAASAAAAAVVAIVFLSFPKPPNIDQMLADTYSQERTLPLRIAGAGHADLQQRRATNQESLFQSNPQALKAQDAITLLCKQEPDSGECLLNQAELNLLDWRYQPAFTSLNKVKPELLGSEKYLLAHSTALFEEAELNGADPELYGQAISDLTKILLHNPRNTTALFNRAWIYEKLNWTENASADWQAFLAIEKDPGWREEAQGHLDLIEQKKNRAH